MKIDYWKYAAELKRVDAKISSLRNRMQVDKSMINKLQDKRKSLVLQLAQEGASKKSALRGKNLTDSILYILAESQTPLPVSEILYRVQVGGYSSNVKDPYTNVYVMCQRLSLRGMIEETISDGKKAYQQKK